MKFETLKIDHGEDGVTTVFLNRPDKRNALSPRLNDEMVAALEGLRYDDETRVVVITGTGEAFCAGMDLQQFFTELKDDPHEFDRVARASTEWRGRTLRYFPKPTIAMVNGYCFGGAFSIVEGCDLAFAADEAVFGLSEINMKFFPGGPVSWSLGKLMRPRDALYYAMTGRTFDGKEAEKIGFVNASVPSGELRGHVMDVAWTLAGMDAAALAATKITYRSSLGMDWDAAMNFASAKQAELTQVQQDAWRSEGMGDFIKGRYRPGLEAYRQQ